MIRFVLILLLCLATPAFAQQNEVKPDKPATSQKKSDRKSKTKKQSNQSENKSNESNSAQDEDSNETSDDEGKKEEKKAKPINTGILAGALKFRSVGPAFMSGRICLLYTSPSPRDRTRSRMPSSA